MDLEPIDRYEGRFDVVASMGVLEHVTDPAGLLRSMARLVVPGGILLVYTPAWGLYDRLTTVVAQWTGVTRLIGRRINRAHLQIFSVGAMRRAMTEAGLAVESIKTLCEYNLPPELYLRSMGLPSWPAAPLRWLMRHGLFFRNNMQVIARRLS